MILILFDRPRESVRARVSSPGTWKTNSTYSFSRHSTSKSDPFKEPPNSVWCVSAWRIESNDRKRRVPDFSSLRSRLVSTRNLIMAQNPHPRAIDMSSPNFEQLHSKNIDDLYEVLGRSLVSPEYPGAAVVTKQVATQRGRAFVSGSLDKLRTKICVDWHYCDKRTQYVNFQALANAVAPLVSSAVGVPIATAIIVAIILIKLGLNDLCKCTGA